MPLAAVKVAKSCAVDRGKGEQAGGARLRRCADLKAGAVPNVTRFVAVPRPAPVKLRVPPDPLTWCQAGEGQRLPADAGGAGDGRGALAERQGAQRLHRGRRCITHEIQRAAVQVDGRRRIDAWTDGGIAPRGIVDHQRAALIDGDAGDGGELAIVAGNGQGAAVDRYPHDREHGRGTVERVDDEVAVGRQRASRERDGDIGHRQREVAGDAPREGGRVVDLEGGGGKKRDRPVEHEVVADQGDRTRRRRDRDRVVDGKRGAGGVVQDAGT